VSLIFIHKPQINICSLNVLNTVNFNERFEKYPEVMNHMNVFLKFVFTLSPGNLHQHYSIAVTHCIQVDTYTFHDSERMIACVALVLKIAVRE